MASFSIGSIMFAMAILVEMGFSSYALSLVGTLLAFGKKEREVMLLYLLFTLLIHCR